MAGRLPDETSGYPGLEVVLRQAFDRARAGLPKDVGVAVMFAFHYGEHGGLAWLAGTTREDAISAVVEWLRNQVNTGHGEVVKAAFTKWFGRQP